MRPVLALVLLCLGLGAAQASTQCEAITRITGCIECMAKTKVCMLCHRDRTPAYNVTSGKITACKPAASVGVTCRTRSRDAECARCDASNWCFQCSLNKYFDANWNCVPNGAAKGACKQVSRNPDCMACNPDNTCKECANSAHLVVPMSAIYINLAGSETRCMPLTRVRTEGLDLIGATPALPTGCREITPDFKCARCATGFTLTELNKCVKYNTAGDGSCGKAAGLQYREYCSKCARNKAGRWVCTKCTWGRRPDAAGACSLNCKRLFGIGCLECTATRCTRADPEYANGRR